MNKVALLTNLLNTPPTTYLRRMEGVASAREAIAQQWVGTLLAVDKSAYIKAVTELDKLSKCLAHPFNDN